MSPNDAHDDGYDAYWDGVDVSDNPNDEETDERRSWEEGWRAARKHDYDEGEGVGGVQGCTYVVSSVPVLSYQLGPPYTP